MNHSFRIILLLPLFCCIFMIGWLLYWAGEPKRQIRQHETITFYIASPLEATH